MISITSGRFSAAYCWLLLLLLLAQLGPTNSGGRLTDPIMAISVRPGGAADRRFIARAINLKRQPAGAAGRAQSYSPKPL